MLEPDGAKSHGRTAVFVLVALSLSAWFAGHCLAQTQPAAPGIAINQEYADWLKAAIGVGLFSGPGIAIWYLWYDVRYVKPRMERIANEQRKEMEERHAKDWALSQANSRADLQGIVTSLTKLAETMEKRVCKYEGEPHGSRPER